jgi:hypothetical protein
MTKVPVNSSSIPALGRWVIYLLFLSLFSNKFLFAASGHRLGLALMSLWLANSE